MWKSLAWATLFQSVPGIVLMAGVFIAARPFVPFLRPLSPAALVGVSLLWGAIAITRSPSATLGILSQTRATGPVTRSTLTFVMTSDVVVVVLVAVAMMIARPLIEPAATFSLHELGTLGHELFGSVAIGTTLGLVLAAYLRLVDRQISLVLVALGFGATEVLRYLRFDALLTFMVAGFVVQNLSRQGEKLTHATGDMGTVVYVVFFATAGAQLDVPLLQKLWPVALVLAAVRGLYTFAAARIGSRVAGDSPEIPPLGLGRPHRPGGPRPPPHQHHRPRLPGLRRRLRRARRRHRRHQRDRRPGALQARARPHEGDLDRAATFAVDADGRGGAGGLTALGLSPRSFFPRPHPPAPLSLETPLCLLKPIRRGRGGRTYTSPPSPWSGPSARCHGKEQPDQGEGGRGG